MVPVFFIFIATTAAIAATAAITAIDAISATAATAAIAAIAATAADRLHSIYLLMWEQLQRYASKYWRLMSEKATRAEASSKKNERA